MVYKSLGMKTKLKNMNSKFFDEIVERFKKPWDKTAFNLYFFVIVILYGGAGIIASMYQYFISTTEQNIYSISQNMATYFIALTAASLVDIALDYNTKNKPSFAISSIFTSGLVLILFLYAYNTKGTSAFILGFIGILISLFIWVLANYENKKLDDENYYKTVSDNSQDHGANWGNK